MSNEPTCESVHATSTSSGMGRRSLVGGLLAGALAATGLEFADAKKGNGKGRGKGKGKKKGKGHGKGKGKQKVQICHRTGNGFNLISVSQSAIPAHEGHGDVICAVGVCQTGVATGCVADGTCEFALVAVGTACTSNGVTGACTAEGKCLPPS